MSAERQAFFVVGTASGADSPVHCRAWSVPDDGDALDQLAATLTGAYGEPREWISDDPGGQLTLVFLDTEPG